LTQPPPDDDAPELTDDDAPDAPPKKRKRRPKLAAVPPNAEASSDDWRVSLRFNANNQITKDPGNAALILTHDPDWAGCLAMNDFTHTMQWLKRPPLIPGLEPPSGPFADHHVLYIQQYLAKRHGQTFSDGGTFSAAVAAAMKLKFHPVQDYLRSLKWDATQRLPSWLSRYFGAEPSEYLSQVGVAWMISAVARGMKPGCKADYMLVLEGKQGAKKSSALSLLFGDEWFTDSQIPIGSDEAYKKLQGKWCIEVAELDAFRGKASTQIKGFITSTKDTYRPSYGRVDQDFPRTCVFVGTTNEREYLVDRTGNRRFWPVKVGEIDRPAIQSDRDQLWAEAVARYDSGEQWWLNDEALARGEQRAREVREPWFDIIATWLERPTIYEQLSGTRRLVSLHDGVTQAEIFEGALKMRPSEMEARQQQRIGFVMHKLGFIRRRPRVGSDRQYKYFLD
jgi:putative DNA primase/helicase